MRVAILSCGGISQFNTSLYQELSKEHTVRAYNFKRQYPEFLFPGKTQYIEDGSRPPFEAVPVLDTANPFSYIRTARAISAWKPDLLLMRYWMPYFAPSQGYVARHMPSGCRVISILDNVIPHERHFWDGPLTRYYLGGHDGFVVLCNAVRDDLLHIRPDARYIVSPHPIYSNFGDKIPQAQARAELGLDPDRKTLLFFGLIREYKGLDILLEAFSTLDSSYQLLIGGETYGSFERYQRLIDCSPNRERIHLFNRFISDHRIPLLPAYGHYCRRRTAGDDRRAGHGTCNGRGECGSCTQDRREIFFRPRYTHPLRGGHRKGKGAAVMGTVLLQLDRFLRHIIKYQVMKAITQTDFNFRHQTGKYEGKVRDVYTIDDNFIVMIATDRISAFDVILPKGITYKGQVLNQIASMFLDATSDIVQNWKISTPDPMVTIGYKCQGLPIEMIVRGYLTGSAWRAYKNGAREICGVPIPDGMREHQRFEHPVITPTTKAEIGTHDEDISKEEILRRGLVSPEDYAKIEDYALRLFQRGTEMAAQRGLILVDTKYEFGKRDGEIYLIDEIHTPDSSRYFYADGYEERFAKGEPQRQLSKEFVREWLMENGFSGQSGQKIPEMTDERVKIISDRYIELFEHITGKRFEPAKYGDDPYARIENNINNTLARLV